jgi:hypothetical protein
MGNVECVQKFGKESLEKWSIKTWVVGMGDFIKVPKNYEIINTN